MSLLQDPRIFNYILLALFACNMARWGWEGDLLQLIYWTGALLCTAGVTFAKGGAI